MRQINKVWWNVIIKKEYIILDNKRIKVICLLLNDRSLQLVFGQNSPLYWSRQELSFYNEDCSKQLHIKIPRWYKNVWVSYDKYDVVLTLLHKEINQFRN